MMATFDDSGLTAVSTETSTIGAPDAVVSGTPPPRFDESGLAQPVPKATADSEIVQKYKSGFYDDNPLKKSMVEELIKRGTLSVDPMKYIDPAMVMGSAAVAESVAGLAGIAGAILPGEEGQGADWISSTREFMTKKPASQESADILEGIGEAVEPVMSKFTDTEKWLGDAAFDLTGSPALAAAAATTPTLLLELIGLRSLKSLRRGERLLDAAGNPTEVLKIELNRKGLNFDTLSPEAKALIPAEVEAGNLPGSKPIRKPVEQALVKQIESGAREDALAPFKAENGRLRPDPVGAEAINQGFRPGFVQAIKTSNPATKAKMRDMVDIMRKSKANERFAMDHRPSDVAGDAVAERLTYIRNEASLARRELDTIAETKLRGQPVDTSRVFNQLDDSLYDLDIDLVPDADGVPRPKFEGSMISKDTSSQKVIKDLVDLLGEGGAPDALRVHKLKRQIDIMIDYSRKSPQGLTDAGQVVLSKVRKSLNDTVRDIDPDYARVNDVMSTSLQAMDALDDAVGSIAIFGEGAGKAMGTRLRALMSNQQGKTRIENAINQLNEATEKLGGKNLDDIKDLVMFSNGLDSKFGTMAKTSFSGQVSQGVEEALRGGPKAAGLSAVASWAGRKIKDIRGIDDYNAFKSLDELLK